jgi:probable phosphoglycerate mutase
VTILGLVRHGQTDWNLNRRIQGSSDIPLNETGRKQAEASGRFLAERQWQGIYASPLSRARETARIISAIVGLGEPIVIPGIQERNYGEAEGLNAAQIMERFPGGAEVPGRETQERLIERSLGALEGIAEDNIGRSVIVVAHGGVIGSVVRSLTDNALPVPGEPILNGSVTDLGYHDGSLILKALNQVPVGDALFENSLF